MVQPPDQAVTRDSLPSQVAAELEDRVVTGEMAVGERLPSERDLAEVYGVSRAVVREALRLLAARGVVSVRQGSGAFVREASFNGADNPIEFTLRRRSLERPLWELFEVRRTLEVELAGLAAERAVPDSVAAMEAAVIALTGARPDEDWFVSNDLAFHDAVANAAQNDLFLLLLEPLQGLLREFRHLAYRRDSSQAVATAQREHGHILAAIRQADAAGARAAMRSHLEGARWVYATQLPRRHPDRIRGEGRATRQGNKAR